MPKLYELTAEIESVLAAADSETGELPEDLSSRLDALGLQLDDKIDQCCRLIRHEQTDAAGYKSESTRLDDLAKAAWGRADRLKEYVRSCLDSVGVTKLKTPLFSLNVVKNSMPTTTVIIPPEELPSQYQRVKVEPDSRKLVELWKANPDSLPAGVIVEVRSHLRIK